MKIISIFAAFFLLSTSGYAQQFHNSETYYEFEAKAAARIKAATQFLHCDTLSGAIPTLFSKGYKVRAKTIQSLVEECAAYYKQKFPEVKFDLENLILNQKDWSDIHLTILSNYGMPNYVPEDRMLFIPADKKAVAKLFGEPDTFDDTHVSDFDCIALHELGHYFFQTANKLYSGKLWVDEFLASYFAICFFEQHKEYPGLPQVGQTGYTPKYRTLADLERLYSDVGDRNYGWYQAQFQNLGYLLYPKFKTELIKKFIENSSASGKKLPPLDLLKQLAPETMNQWLKGMK